MVAACEAVAAAAGYDHIYIQAAIRQRDRGNILGDWLPMGYNAAVATYERAGYDTWRPKAGLLDWDKVDRSAVLMHKHFCEW
jgi:hypothetical protein